MVKEDQIREALRACFDAGNPYGKPLNVVDLGLVHSIVLTLDRDAPGYGIPGVPPRQQLELALVPCTKDEDARAMLLAQIANMLAGLPELSRTSARFVDDPIWSPERISPALRRTLKLDRPIFPILNNRLR
jgi:metal-sulfur cluster biosynthetic enzyme